MFKMKFSIISMLIALVMVAGSAWATDSWSDNFNSGAQQTWTVVNNGTNTTHIFTNDRYELYTEYNISSSTDGAAAYYVGGMTGTDCIMQAKVEQIASDDKFLAYLIARTDATNMNAYTLGISSGNDSDNEPHLWLGKLTAGAYSTLAGADASKLPWGSGNYVWYDCYLKFAVVGDNMYGKIWKTTDSEPAEWQVTATDASFATAGVGGVMLATYHALSWNAVKVAFDDVSFAGSPNEVWVDDDYTTASCGGHDWGYDAFDNIQGGIDVVLAGGTVNVAAGTYTITSAINVNKGVTITGNTTTPANVLVTYASPSQILDCFDMQANNVTVQGIKVVNGRYGFNFAVTDPTGCIISDCVIDHCYEGAINIDGGSGHTISNNTITSCLTSGTKRGAIHIFGCPNTIIDGNTLIDNGLTGHHATMGIYVKFTYPSSSSERVEVINNNISGMLGINGDIQVYDAPYTYIYNNTISNSEDKGIAIWGIDGSPAYTSTDNRVEVIGNTISSTYYPGLQACNAPYTYFYNNTLTRCNYYGGDGTGDFDYASIHIDVGSSDCLIDNNTVTDGINGIQLWSNNCTVTNNTIYSMGKTYADTKTTGDGTYYNSAILYGDMYNVNMPTSATISGNDIYGNYWGLFVISTYSGTVIAENNWWGHVSGPYHASTNPGGTGDAVSDNVDYDPWTEKGPGGNVTATSNDYNYDTDDVVGDDITLNFSTLPPGGGCVSISREDGDPGIPADELPDGVTSGDVVPISLSFFSDMENGSFEVTITITGVDITDFTAADLYIAYYSNTSEEWILVPCTVTGSGTSGIIEFTINHFTDIIIVDPENPIHIFLDGDYTSVAEVGNYDDIIYPTWNQLADDGVDNDDGYYETGNAHIYVTPGVYAAHDIAAVDFRISYDKTKLAMSAPVKGGAENLFGATGVMTYDTPTIVGNTKTYTIHTANLSTLEEGKTTDGKLYLADLPFTLASPGYGEVTLEVIFVRYWNTSELKQYGLAKTPHDASFKFYLGDVGDEPSTPTVGDGRVEFYDLNIWTSTYWTADGETEFLDKCDIGPTEDTWVFTWPTDGVTPSANGGDGVIGFEDLCIFSISWGYTASDAYPKLAPNSNTPVNIWAENKDGGEYTYVPIRIDARNAQLRAGSFTINTPGYELVEVIPGELLKRGEPIFIESRQRDGFVDVDLAVIGHQTEPINDDGTLFTLKLKGNGVTSVSNVILRDMDNNDVPFVLNKEEVAALPSEFALIGATPNPFNATTAINFSVPYEAKVRIEIHDLTGRTIATLVDDEFDAGRHSIIWNGSDNSGGTVSSGTYIVRMSSEDFSASSRITLIK